MRTNQAIDFNQWVNDHNPAENLSYGKGWWDYIEIIRRLAGKFDIEDRDNYVVSTYLMKTYAAAVRRIADAGAATQYARHSIHNQV